MSFAVPEKALRPCTSLAQDNPTPLVIVEGFLGGANAVLWGNFEEYLNCDSKTSPSNFRRRSIFASVGPVSSLHDRACELYYALMGGTVDYGAEHSNIHHHSRFGRTNSKGLYPQWSRERPLHFLGHSMGGPTIVKLQSLMKRGHFGERAHPDMVLSLTTISAPFRGTPLTYTLGERADAAPAVRPLSVGSFIGKAVHLLSFLSPFLPRTLDFHADSRSLSFRDTSFFSLLKQLWKSDWAESRDATPFDVTFEAMDERESNFEGQVHPTTFYRSHVACMTQRTHQASNNHSPSLGHIISPPLYFSSLAVGAFDFSILRPVPSFVNSVRSSTDRIGSNAAGVEQAMPPKPPAALPTVLGEEYWANDGIVPLFSQWHPLPCSSTKCRHYESSVSDTMDTQCLEGLKGKPEHGIWHVYQTDEASHVSLAPVWMSTSRQKLFWDRLGCWLRDIDAVHSISP